MNKKNIISLKPIIALIVLLACIPAFALNQAIGEWKIFGTFANPAQKVIDSKDKVYYLSGGCLYSYDKSNDESYTYTIGNKLNDVLIQNIYYNYDKKYLAIVYSNMNIDILYEDGRVVNMSDLVDATFENDTNTINSVSFDGDYMYVCATYGITQFNVARGEVKQSGIYSKGIKYAFVLGDKLMIHDGTNYYYINKDSNIAQFNRFTSLGTSGVPTEIIPLNDTEIIVFTQDPTYQLLKVNFDFDYNTCSAEVGYSDRHSVVAPYLIHGEGGKFYYFTDGNLYGLDENYHEVKLCTLPEDFTDTMIGTYKGADEVYSLNGDGLACHGFDGEGGVTLYMDRFAPESLSVSQPYYFYPAKDPRYLFIRNLGSTIYKFNMGSNLGRDRIHNASRLDMETGEATNMTIHPIETIDNSKLTHRYATAVQMIAPDPDDPDIYYAATPTEGVYKVKNGKLVGRYNNLNAPFVAISGRYVAYGVSVDNGGNLWVVRSRNANNPGAILVLPAEKRKLDPSEVTKEDWIALETGDFSANGQEIRHVHCKKSNWVIQIDHNGTQYFLAYNTKGTYNDFSDDECFAVNELIDQDGNYFEPGRRVSIVEDNDGKIWLGTGEGIFEFDPRKINSKSVNIKRIKVPRNDGTGLADYLAGTDFTYDITVDASNRKWVGTSDSGLYLVSPDGSKILKNFTKENSPLPSNMITALYADPNSSTLFVGTPNTLLAYGTGVVPESEDLNEVIAYPNPVRPEYQGDIYIKGLMDNTLVKICNAAGSVLYQGRSEGGMLTWDGCDRAGNRVKTGVYYVYMSNNSTGKNQGAVTKIMVVN